MIVKLSLRFLHRSENLMVAAYFADNNQFISKFMADRIEPMNAYRRQRFLMCVSSCLMQIEIVARSASSISTGRMITGFHTPIANGVLALGEAINLTFEWKWSVSASS